MNPHVQELQFLDPGEAFRALATLPYSLFFDSADTSHSAGRYSFILSHPIEMIEAKDGLVTITNSHQQTAIAGDPLTILQERIDACGIRPVTIEGLPPFQGGAAGLFSYDLGRSFENIPAKRRNNRNMPDMAVGIYDQVIAFDHHQNKAWLISHESKKESAKKRTILKMLEKARKHAKPFAPTALDWKSNFTAAEYKKAVTQTIEYIRTGDIFQANLSQRFDAELPKNFDAFAHYMLLRSINPAPFAGFMNFGELQISSASPERFLTVRGREVETRPIKGTRPRSPIPGVDRIYRNLLENSEKERAENTMIVDLMRNDLSKVCEPGSIDVARLCNIESFATVHHLVSTVRGVLGHGRKATDLLRACFPGGSITGAPKIRAMEIIEEMEQTRRGPYCGSMGYIGFNGAMDSNILIRTLVYEGQNVSLQAGGGIVADSVPQNEYQETLDKAEAMLRSFKTDAAEMPMNSNILATKG